MKNMNNLVFPYDSSEHGSLTKKIMGVISSNKEIELLYPFQKQTRAPVEAILHSNRTEPLWVGLWQRWAMPPFANFCCQCRICPCCLSAKVRREKLLPCWTSLPWHYQGLIHMGVKGSKIYSVCLIASLHLPWKPENRWSSDFSFPLW